MKKLLMLVALGVAFIALGWLGGQQPQNPLKAAELAYRRGEYVRAAQLYERGAATTADPGHTAFNRAAALYQLGLFDVAADDFRTAGAYDQRDRSARACYDLGNCSLRLACQMEDQDMAKHLREAVAYYDACLIQSAGVDHKLLEDAWHNQELARRLLAQLEPNRPDVNPRRSSQDQSTARGGKREREVFPRDLTPREQLFSAPQQPDCEH